MPLTHDTLADQDRARLPALAVRIGPHAHEVIAAWGSARSCPGNWRHSWAVESPLGVGPTFTLSLPAH
ncbi:MAG: hypothetical protein ACE5I7_14365 [Candidatus Binatia bacterium]